MPRVNGSIQRDTATGDIYYLQGANDIELATGGNDNFIQNGTSPQTANFNITGSGQLDNIGLALTAPASNSVLKYVKSFTLNNSTPFYGFNTGTTFSKTGADFDKYAIGGVFHASVGASNTANWIGDGGIHNPMTAAWGQIDGEAGATGRIDKAAAFNAVVDVAGGDYTFIAAYNASRLNKTAPATIDTLVGYYASDVNAGTTNYSFWATDAVARFDAGAQIGTVGRYSSGSSGTLAGSNIYFDGTDYRYLTTAAGSLFQQNSGTSVFYTAPSGTAGNVASLTSQMQISPLGGIQVGSVGRLNSVGGNTLFSANIYFDGSDYRHLTTAAGTLIQQNNGTVVFYNAVSASAGSVATLVETARITPSGVVRIAGLAGATTRMATVGTSGEIGVATIPGGGGGSVTGVAGATANGFAMVSDGAAVVPTLTISTTVTGMLKGNGTSISAAVAGTDYLAGGSGTYTPTNSSNTNISSITIGKTWYTRIGDIVTVSGTLTITPTSATTTSTVLTLPVAATFANLDDLSGTGTVLNDTGITYLPLSIDAETTNERAQLSYRATSTNSQTIKYTFSYSL